MLGCFLEHLVRIYIFRSPTQLSCSVSSRGPRRLREGGGGQGAKTRPPIRRQRHASSHEGGAESCSADPQQVKGLGWGVGEGRGQGLVAVEDRDAIWPSRAPSTKPIQRRGRGLWNTLTETTPTPPETHTPAGWRPGPLRRDGHTQQHGVRRRRTEGRGPDGRRPPHLITGGGLRGLLSSGSAR